MIGPKSPDLREKMWVIYAITGKGFLIPDV